METPKFKYARNEPTTLLSVPYPPPSRTKRQPKIFHTVKYLLLLSLALTLSTLLPTPWSLTQSLTRSLRYSNPKSLTSDDPASEWKDDIWPLRPQTPWDISTSYPFPRVLEYDVQEGTWLRLDVHPKSGDIVFDMLGDLYCLPGQAYSRSQGSVDVAKAYPILLGVPHDSDPHFSPEGERIVFRSDAELGVENVWVMRWTRCEEMNVRPMLGIAGDVNEELVEALKAKDIEDDWLAKGIEETSKRKRRRMLREGRLRGTFYGFTMTPLYLLENPT